MMLMQPNPRGLRLYNEALRTWREVPFVDRFIPQYNRFNSPFIVEQEHYYLTTETLRAFVEQDLMNILGFWIRYDLDVDAEERSVDHDSVDYRDYRKYEYTRPVKLSLQTPALSQFSRGTLHIEFSAESLAVTLDFPHSCYSEIGIYLAYEQRTLPSIRRVLSTRLSTQDESEEVV
jgi:hypothetical protein